MGLYNKKSANIIGFNKNLLCLKCWFHDSATIYGEKTIQKRDYIEKELYREGTI